MKTHYRKAFSSPYLASADLVEDTILTISHVSLDPDKTKRTKDLFNTAYFVEKEIRPGEKLKPMILNAHNSAIVSKFADSKFIEDWTNIPVTIYVNHSVRMGSETVEGLRISPVKPVKKELTPENTKGWERAKEAFKRDGDLRAVLNRVDISKENQEKLMQECA